MRVGGGDYVFWCGQVHGGVRVRVRVRVSVRVRGLGLGGVHFTCPSYIHDVCVI